VTGKERVRTAMRNGTPDCVPFIPQICVPHAVRSLGLDFESVLLDVVRQPLRMNELSFACARRYGVDGVRAWIPPDPLDVVREDGVWYGCDPKTGKRVGRVDLSGGGGVLPSDESTLRTQDDIDAIPLPSVSDILQSGKLDGIKHIIAEAGEDCFVISSPGPFTPEYLTFVRGKERALMDLIDQPDFCHKAQEKALQVALQYAFALTEIGIDGLLLGDTFGGIVGPTGFKEFYLPYFQRFITEMRGRYGTRCPVIYLHICGNSTRLLELMADTGVDCIEPLDPLGGVVVKDAKERVGQRVALMGGVHTVKLAHGTLAEVEQDIQRCLSEGAPGGGYVLACGDMLPTETSSEKVEAMLSAARSYAY
jgi:uroporphyrinogen-III decarboxylase